QERLRKAQEADNSGEAAAAAAEIKKAQEALRAAQDADAQDARAYMADRDNRARADQEVEAAQAEVDRLQAEVDRLTALAGSSPPPAGTDVAKDESDDPKKFLDKLTTTLKETDEELK